VLAAADQWPHVVDALVGGACSYVLKAEAALLVAVEAAVGQGAFVSARAVPGLVRVV
jgi:DNA-binding NarL/FixJ family response regulator